MNSSEVKPTADPASLALRDTEAVELLCEALRTPPVPDSLLQTLDQAVADRWGESPQLVQPRRLWWKRGGAFWNSRSARWLMGTAVALAVIAAVLIRPPQQAYGWSAVLRALERRPLVMIEGEDSWLSVAQRRMAIASGASRLHLWDFRRGTIQQRLPGSDRIEQARLPRGGRSSQREQLALHWMISAAASDASTLVPAWQVVGQQWDSRGEQAELRLDVRHPERALTLVLAVDPASQLPQWFQVDGEGFAPQRRMLVFADRGPERWVSEHFPQDVPVVEVARLSPDTAAAASLAATEPAPPADDSKASSATLASGENALAEAGPAGAAGPADSPRRGSASLNWQPLADPGLTDDQLVAAVDRELARLWRDFQLTPAPLAANEELLRRVYLDLAGRTPSVNEVRQYLQDHAPDKYERLVDQLLRSRDHATHLAAVWRTFLLPEGVDLTDFGGTEAFDQWLAQHIHRGTPYDQLVRELLLAEGRLAQSGPLLFYSAAKLDAHQLAARSARVFLGIRLECAQCHDDPFEPWTQEDFWSYAAFFARISRPQAKLEAVSRLMQVRDVDRGEVMLPETETVVAPRLLDGRPLPEGDGVRRRLLADWLVDTRNPYFAKATVNRVWAQLFGRGIVNPVDGFGKLNPPAAPAVLDLVAGQFAHRGYDLRRLFRTLALTRAYRLSSGFAERQPSRPEPADAAQERQRLFAQMSVKMLTAEQVFDCIAVASMLGAQTTVELSRTGNAARDAFLQRFRTPGGITTDYQGGIPQALTLMNGSLIQGATGVSSSGLLESLQAPFFSDPQRVEIIYLATLSRTPTEAEWKLLRKYLADAQTETREESEAESTEPPAGREQRDKPNRATPQADQRTLQALADILWAVLNSAEFTMNH